MSNRRWNNDAGSSSTIFQQQQVSSEAEVRDDHNNSSNLIGTGKNGSGSIHATVIHHRSPQIKPLPPQQVLLQQQQQQQDSPKSVVLPSTPSKKRRYSIFGTNNNTHFSSNNIVRRIEYGNHFMTSCCTTRTNHCKPTSSSTTATTTITTKVVTFVAKFILITIFLNLLFSTGFWLFNHIQCYSREFGITWTEGISHSVKTRACPQPNSYNDYTNDNDSNGTQKHQHHQFSQQQDYDRFYFSYYLNPASTSNVSSSNDNTSNIQQQLLTNKNHRSIIEQNRIDPSKICITSLSDSSTYSSDMTSSLSSSSKEFPLDTKNFTSWFEWIYHYSFFLIQIQTFIHSIFSSMFTVSCRDFTSVQQYTWPLTIKYCQKHGYTCYEASHLVDKNRPPAWSKIRAVLYLFNSTVSTTRTPKNSSLRKKCEWVLWMDADTLIMNSAIKIESLLPPSIEPTKKATHTIDSNSDYSIHGLENEINLIVTYDKKFTANSGVWLIRNNDWSIQFLNDWWNMRHFVRPKGFSLSGDNAAFGTLIRTREAQTILPNFEYQQYKQQQLVVAANNSNNMISNEDGVLWKQYPLQQHDPSGSGLIRLLPRCTMNSFGVFIDTKKHTKRKRMIQNSITKAKMENNIREANVDIDDEEQINIAAAIGTDWYMSEQFYHSGDFIAHASGIDQKEAGIKLLVQRAT